MSQGRAGFSRYYNGVRRFFALAFLAFAAPAEAQVSTLFPLDRFWTRTLEAPFAAAPVSDGFRVYVALQTGRLIAFDPRNDAIVWSVELAADGAAIVAANRLLVPAAGAIHALDTATGSLVWRRPAGALAAPLAERGGWLIVALTDGTVQGVRASDGVVVWTRSMGAGAAVASATATEGDLLAVALTDGRIVAMDLPTGTTRWQRSLSAPAGSLTVSGDRIFAGTADGYFWSIEASDGDPDWYWRLGARLIGAPVADLERVYVIAIDNVVRGFSRDSGNMRWSHPLASRPLAGPQLVEGLLVITSGDIGAPGLTYIDAVTGRAAGKTPTLPNITESTRTQFAVGLAQGVSPFALIATASTSEDWQLHGYRQTFITSAIGPLLWGPRYEVRRRLDIRTGVVIWGERITLVPQVPLVP